MQIVTALASEDRARGIFCWSFTYVIISSYEQKKTQNQDNSTCVVPRHVFVCGLTPIMHMSCQQNNNNCNCLVVTVVAVDRTVAPIVVNQPAWRIRLSSTHLLTYYLCIDMCPQCIVTDYVTAGVQCIDEWTYEWTDGWLDGWMVGWMDGWMDGWLIRLRRWKLECQSRNHHRNNLV
uniref:Uncharacterized protein n=1 Tax=Glossina pallidipes TaxID=7398 RepID=A0A1B0AHD4_GLOPL